MVLVEMVVLMIYYYYYEYLLLLLLPLLLLQLLLSLFLLSTQHWYSPKASTAYPSCVSLAFNLFALYIDVPMPCATAICLSFPQGYNRKKCQADFECQVADKRSDIWVPSQLIMSILFLELSVEAQDSKYHTLSFRSPLWEWMSMNKETQWFRYIIFS